MQRNKIFIKKTRKGSILKIVREHYLRDDIYCGSELCSGCSQEPDSIPLVAEPVSKSQLCPTSHYIVPDTNVVLHQVSGYPFNFLTKMS